MQHVLLSKIFHRKFNHGMCLRDASFLSVQNRPILFGEVHAGVHGTWRQMALPVIMTWTSVNIVTHFQASVLFQAS